MFLVIVSAFAIIFLITLLAIMWHKAHNDQVEYHTIVINHMPKHQVPLRIFFITDIHTRVVDMKTINQIKQDIDLVIIGGDLLESGVRLEQVERNIKTLRYFNAPIYFIWGNNDYEVNDQKLSRLLEDNDVVILKNRSANIPYGSGIISIIGIDCYNMGEPNMEKALTFASGDTNILITHDPQAFYECTDQQINNIDLVLSGHTHGGQIRILGWGPYTKGGLKWFKGVPLFISEGYGYTKLPLRLGTQSECHVIKLISN